MTEIRGHNPEGNREPATSAKIDSPEFEEFNTGDYHELAPRWRANHAMLLDLIRQKKPHFFGMHGTTRSNIDSLIASKAKGRLEMATFYKKEEAEIFLYKLYSAANYCSRYAIGGMGARERNPGGILVFDVEEHGRNSTTYWEPIGPTPLRTTLDVDTPEEQALFSSLFERKNSFSRTDAWFEPEEFDQKYKGFVDLTLLEKYYRDLDSTAQETGNPYMRLRFFGQETSAQVLDLVTK